MLAAWSPRMLHGGRQLRPGTTVVEEELLGVHTARALLLPSLGKQAVGVGGLCVLAYMVARWGLWQSAVPTFQAPIWLEYFQLKKSLWSLVRQVAVVVGMGNPDYVCI